MNAIAMIERSARHQRGPGPTGGAVPCAYCQVAAATEVVNGEPACHTCAAEVLIERLLAAKRAL